MYAGARWTSGGRADLTGAARAAPPPRIDRRWRPARRRGTSPHSSWVVGKSLLFCYAVWGNVELWKAVGSLV